MEDLSNVKKGTVSVISSDTPWKDGKARFTSSTLVEDIVVFLSLKVFNADNFCVFSEVEVRKSLL